ncbi:hypothetical protein B0H16DRAFT_1555387 [Mycena metata]|uniref:Secreted protein n=1 Tax=Mycena metata TaxID=1033252 RepID=A0AAD7N5D7_9AGAR|nr:hypothetical protein B0H16DRAFT_1555387 [Mycena metata]
MLLSKSIFGLGLCFSPHLLLANCADSVDSAGSCAQCAAVDSGGQRVPEFFFLGNARRTSPPIQIAALWAQRTETIEVCQPAQRSLTQT